MKPSAALFLLLLFGGLGPGPSLQALDWFRWRGPALNGISSETNWTSAWPQEGPRQLWKASVGIGFSSVSVRQGRVYTMGNAAGKDTVFCFDAETGQVVWKHSYACGLRPQYYEGGTSVTPTLDGDQVYTLSKEGHLFSFRAADGAIAWQKNLTNATGAWMPRWGFAGSPLVQGQLLVLNAGPAGMALDKHTGQVVWASGSGAAGYATPVPITLEGQSCLLIFSAKALVCVTLEQGRELWRHPWVTQWDLNVVDPIVDDARVFISSFDRGGALLRVSLQGATELWQNKEMANHFTSCVLFNGSLFGIHGNTDKPPAELRAVNFDTGAVEWKYPGLGFGSLMLAGGKLIVLSDKGELLVAPASRAGFQTMARAQVLGGKCWTQPVLSDGRIYCRNAQGTLICLEVKAEK